MIMYYLKIIRWQNILLLMLLQYLLRYCMALPILELQNLGLLLTDKEFFILSLSCALIAAGGYVINDIEDIEIDRINKPEKQIAGKQLSVSSAYNYYYLLTFFGLAGGMYLTFVKEYSYLFYVMLVTAGLLYFYSTSYKCIPVIGNVVIGLLSALSVFIVIMNEPFARENQGVMFMVGIFMIFSFLTTVLREFIKDMEDAEGDLACDCQTLANAMGKNSSRWLALIFSLLIFGLLVLLQIVTKQWESLLPFTYIVLCVELPLLYVTYLLYTAKGKEGFSAAGNWLKLIMFAFVMSLLVFYYSFNT